MFWHRFPHNKCCLCGESERLTGEHKIKASALRDEFGSESLCVGTMNAPAEKMRLAQSPNSKHLKFQIPICEKCNTSRTQQADREFDLFHQLAKEKVSCRDNPSNIFNNERYKENSDPYLNVFRYFAKLLSCHLATSEAPIPISLAQFAISRNTTNCIDLEVKKDPTYHHINEQIGIHQYAAHGGLVVYGNRNTKEPSAFHSTLTVGALQYVFSMRLNELEVIELRERFPDFYDWCRSIIEHTIQNPMSESLQLRLGIREQNA